MRWVVWRSYEVKGEVVVVEVALAVLEGGRTQPLQLPHGHALLDAELGLQVHRRDG